MVFKYFKHIFWVFDKVRLLETSGGPPGFGLPSTTFNRTLDRGRLDQPNLSLPTLLQCDLLIFPRYYNPIITN